jgi:hypothetical protein
MVENRSSVAGITAALLSRAGAFGRKGDYEHAVEDATQVIVLAPSPVAPSPVAYYKRALPLASPASIPQP